MPTNKHMFGTSAFQSYIHETRIVITGHFLCHEREIQIQTLNTALRKAKIILEGQQLELIMLIHYCGAQSRLSLVDFFDELATVECFKNRANHVVWGFADDKIFELGEGLVKRCGLPFQFLNLGITSQPQFEPMAFSKWAD
jgi:hypothetical protein